jgi:hypothetical protein
MLVTAPNRADTWVSDLDGATLNSSSFLAFHA